MEKLFCVFDNGQKIYFIFELMERGDMFYHLQKNPSGRFSETQARFYAAAILLGLKQFHEQGIIFRDLKPENILFNAKGYPKLNDFGLQRLMKIKEIENTVTHNFSTPDYIAPELLLGE